MLITVIAALEAPALAWMLQLSPGVEIPIRVPVLGRSDSRDIPIDAAFQNGIGLGRQKICRPADHLINQPVIPRRARVAAGFTITNAVKVIERSTPIVLKF